MTGAHLDVLAEAAGSNQHTFGCANVDNFSTFGTIEAMVDAGFNTDDAALIVDDQSSTIVLS